MDIYKLARFLGWFSIGLGLMEFLAPKKLGKFLGTEERTGLLRLFGLREIGAGVGILAPDEPPAAALWARVGGDALDLAALSMAAGSSNPKRANVLLSIAAVAGVTALDVYCARELE